MSSKSSSNIASKAYSKAEADFSTWLMMAKLGSFDDLPSNAQNFLTNYRDRLQTMSEAESTVLAVREIYAIIIARWEASAPRQNRKLANQPKRTDRLNISPLDLLRALRSGQ